MEAHLAPLDEALDTAPVNGAALLDPADLAGLSVRRALRPATHPAATPTIDVVIVTHNSRADLERYFDGVERAAARAAARILVVDNASGDRSAEYVLERQAPHVQAIALTENLGYATAVNAAAAHSTADYLVVLNPDIDVRDPDAITRLVAHLEMHPGVGAVAPRLLDPDGGVQSSARPVPNLAMMAARQTPLGRTRWGRRRAERYLRAPECASGEAVGVEWALGAALAVRRADYDRLGGWDEGFFLYFEDVDFCVRLREAGREVHYLPGVALVHDHHRQSDRRNGSAAASAARRTHMRSALRFFRKHPRFAVRRGLVEREATAGEIARRVLDIVLASLLLVALAPVLAAVALAIKLDSPGPVLFRQRRLGRGAQPFTMCKFRTMRSGADCAVHADFVRRMILDGEAVAIQGPCGPIYKVYPDDRVTRVGDVLRRWSLDELPQLWNVLRGDMTLVGFRPPIPYELEHYPEWFHGRFAVKPGLTGLWQVSGRNEKSYSDMVRLDLEYIERRSLWLDLRLLAKTPLAVLRRRGAV